MADSERPLATWAIPAVAFFQGLCLLGLYRSVVTDSWPSDHPVWSFPLWTLALAVPLLWMLSVDGRNLRRASSLVAGFGAILGLLAVYIGWQGEPDDAVRTGGLVFTFTLSVTVACFKALMYLQQRADQVPLTYDVLFTNSWRNFLVGTLAAVFVFVFWLILRLWAGLFSVIEIDYFTELFGEDWFLFPVLSTAFGIGIGLFRKLARIIDSITRLLHWLVKLLLPLALGVAIVFLAALPFVGLEPLWDTGNGTALLLWLLAIILFFINAVYQDGREAKPYPVLVHRLIYVGLFSLPIVAGLSFYGLMLRLLQYGWTVERCWAFVVWLFLALFALGYALGAAHLRDNWPNYLARVNTGMGLVILAVLLLANSPLLDFRKISLASQLSRAESTELGLREFDFWYAKNRLARPGYLAIERIKAEIGDSDPELLQIINSPTPRPAAEIDREVSTHWRKVVYRPTRFDVPDPVRQLVDRQFRGTGDRSPVLIRVDLDEDGETEYVLINLYEHGVRSSRFYYRSEGEWLEGNLGHIWKHQEDEQLERITQGDLRLVDPPFKTIEIGGLRFRPLPKN